MEANNTNGAGAPARAAAATARGIRWPKRFSAGWTVVYCAGIGGCAFVSDVFLNVGLAWSCMAALAFAVAFELIDRAIECAGRNASDEGGGR